MFSYTIHKTICATAERSNKFFRKKSPVYASKIKLKLPADVYAKLCPTGSFPRESFMVQPSYIN